MNVPVAFDGERLVSSFFEAAIGATLGVEGVIAGESLVNSCEASVQEFRRYQLRGSEKLKLGVDLVNVSL